MNFVLDSELLSYLNLLVAFVLPVAVAFVTDRYASSRFKAAALIVLTAVQSVIFSLIDLGVFELEAVVYLFVSNIVVAVASHFGVTKPLGASGKESPIAGTGLPLGSHEKKGGI